MPLFHRGDVVGRWKLVHYGHPIQIGDIMIRCGDLILGDRDGVIAVPQKITLDVLRRVITLT